MSLKYYDTNLLTNIADAIRQQEGTDNLMTVEAMPSHIENISTGGSFRWMSFEGFTGEHINDEDIDFDVEKSYMSMEGRLFCNCSNLRSIPNSINIHKYRNLSYAMYNVGMYNLYTVTGYYPNLVNGSHFYKVNYVIDGGRYNGSMNLFFNLPNAIDLTQFFAFYNGQEIQPWSNWIINIQAPKAQIYDSTICTNCWSFGYLNNTIPQWNLVLNMPNLKQFSNFFNGFPQFNSASSNSWSKLYNILNSITANVTNASYMFSYFNTGSNGYLPNINTSKFEDVSNIFYYSNITGSYRFSNFYNWDLSNVKIADNMFRSASFVNNFSLNIYLPNCVSANYMFHYYSGTRYSHNINLPNCVSASHLLYDADKLQDVPNLYLPNVVDCSYIFGIARNLKNVPENFISYEKVTNIEGIFEYCNNLTNESLTNIAKWLLNINTETLEDRENILNIPYGSWSYRVYNNARQESQYQYHNGIFYGSNKRLNVTTIGSDLVNQLKAKGWNL